MKEATGELNMTIVIVISVGILAAFFYLTVWPAIKGNYEANSMCSKAICKCPPSDKLCSKGMADCYLETNKSKKFQCPWKG